MVNPIRGSVLRSARDASFHPPLIWIRLRTCARRRAILQMDRPDRPPFDWRLDLALTDQAGMNRTLGPEERRKAQDLSLMSRWA